ncbi:hypothetical protein [Actinomadura sp. DC4]|uniref:hypothetical protein n=1 Tax=Actinomadura sp. DC4 TaxID=3055069 RepID=UPI0025B14BE0|nr:hypothetical protein [Actinomadura sp. DC4]MDN3351311.1 hypothetical protein [Actinomadura sp. DC4]
MPTETEKAADERTTDEDRPGEAAEPEAEEPSPSEEPSPERRRLLTAALLTRVMVLVVLAAAVTTALLQWRQAGRLSAREDTRRQVSTRAGEFGQALLSYDHSDPDAARKRVLGMTTDDFGRTYDVAFTDGLQGIITKLKADAKATVRTVYVGDVGGDDAKAVVVMDSEVKSTAGTRRVLGSYLEMELVRQHGQWRVKSVNSIGAINESLTKPDGTTVTPGPTATSDPG